MFVKIKIALKFLIFMTFILGIIYPAVMLGIAQLIFPHKANGDLMKDQHGRIVGFRNIGQEFTKPSYFQGRPSATSYSATSGGSNFALTNPKLQERLQATKATIPSPSPDRLYASGSGIDPHISWEDALQQVDRVSQARQMSRESVIKILEENKNTQPYSFLTKTEMINVLEVNLALDQVSPQ
jgi:K+-transporting ATPase ATPase C chain